MKRLIATLFCCAALVACDQSRQAADSSVQIKSPQLLLLQAQLEGEQSIRDIKQLQYAFSHYISQGSWSDATSLFSSDVHAGLGSALTGIQNDVSGKEHLEAFLRNEFGLQKDQLGEGDLNQHLIISPVINLGESGDSAEGRWRLVAMKGEYQKYAQWLGGIFENQYKKENAVWKISKFVFYPMYGGDYASGWRNLKAEKQEDVKPVPFHYSADSAGVPNPSAQQTIDLGVMGSDQQSLAAIQALDVKAQRLLDQDAVNNLQNAYGYYFDRHMWDDLTDLFYRDGILELDRRGIYQGKQSIRKALNQFGPLGVPANEVNDHLQLQTIVTVAADGLSAKARGTELQELGVHEQESQWGIGIFENDFVKVDGVWQIKSVHVYTRMLTDYNQGWAVDAQPAPQAHPDFPAHQSSSVEYSAYPTFFVPPFNYHNAVLLCESCKVDATTSNSVSVAQAVSELQRKLRVLNAYSGAENVSNAYGYYIDEFMWDGMADVFSENGWKELSYIGSYVGRERVRESVVSRYGRGGRRANGNTFHQKVQPVVTVAEDGNSARIRTRLFQLNSSLENAGSYMSGIYENQVVNENGIWKISAMDLDYVWLANYDGGWQKVVPGSSNRFAPPPGSLQGEQAPDRPLRGIIFPPYPVDQADMAFHYLNPVSGRRPPIYLPEVDYDALTFGE